MWHTRGEVQIMCLTLVTRFPRHVSFTQARARTWIALLFRHTAVGTGALLAVWVTIVTGSALGAIGEVCETLPTMSTVSSSHIWVTLTLPRITITHLASHSVRVAVTSQALLAVVTWRCVGPGQTPTLVAPCCVKTGPQVAFHQTFQVAMTLHTTLVNVVTLSVLPHREAGRAGAEEGAEGVPASATMVTETFFSTLVDVYLAGL